VVLGIALGRLGLGAGALVAPGVPLGLWIADEDAGLPATRLLARALGGRDMALAMGTLTALALDRPVRPWVVAGVVADTGDVAATVAAWRRLPRVRRWSVTCLAAGAALAGAAVAPSCDRP
jgi:hypothetical protein